MKKIESNFGYYAFNVLFPLAVIYLIGAFISWDINPLNWWMLTNTGGRILTVWIIVLYFKFILET